VSVAPGRANGRVLALDLGEVRCGLAISDPERKLATPLAVLPTQQVEGCSAQFQRLLADWQPVLLVAGLPLSLDGGCNSQAARVQAQAQVIAAACQLPLEFFDERLTSREAEHYLRAAGCTQRQMRGKIDAVAASLLLQAWLDAQLQAMGKLEAKPAAGAAS